MKTATLTRQVLAAPAVITGKKGLITPDANGYYVQVVGALASSSANGFDYPNNANNRNIINSPHGILQQRIQKKRLCGEYYHPRPPGMSDLAWRARVAHIHEENVSHHIRKVYVEDTPTKLRDGRYVFLILAELKPSGPYGPALLASIKNPDEDVCYSIRAFSDESLNGINIAKHFKNVVTWDHVNDPGVDEASKFECPVLESLIYTEKDLRAEIYQGEGVTMENKRNEVEIIRTSLGWNKTQILPASMNW